MAPLELCVLTETHFELAQKWSDFLKAPLNPAQPAAYSTQLVFDQDLPLFIDANKKVLRIDFDGTRSDYQRNHAGKRNELIGKALGGTKGLKTVLDLSVGMGVDSVFLSQLGFAVSGVERSPILFTLLSEAFRQSQQECLKNYRLYFGDSYDFLRTPPSSISGQSFDAIYFDPMYPHTRRKSLPKQEMVVFRNLVGHDEDATRVLEAALLWDCQRVVVKRPLQAEPLLPGVRHTFEGKLVRYDIYMRSL